MLQKLIYSKLPPDKDGKYTVENIVNLKSTKKKKKQNEISLTNNNNDNNNVPVLSFESKFESGNLQLAYNTNTNEYQLFLHNDTNTSGYTQWFFFRVNNTRSNTKATFHIMNLLRKKTKYSFGITVWVYSRKKNIFDKIKWHHTNENVSYYTNELYRLIKGRRQYYNTLSFEYTFPYDDDDVYFANCIPFTYTDVMKDLNEYQRFENTKYPYFMRKTLCTTLAGNDLDFITINNTTNHNSNKHINISQCGNNDSSKEGVVLFARQHPSETVGSWAIKGAIDFLMGYSDEARYLREHFVFKIIPMMNPDGVISGNTRTSFAGCDLNRRWINPNDELHPEIYFAKEMILNFADKRKIECIVDFHGHFGAFNAFFYANKNQDNFSACKFFPFICSKTSKVINFDKCKFSMPKTKNGTGRIDLFKELNIENVYTIETSNFGCLNGEYANMYFNEGMLMNIGRDVCLSIMKMHFAKNKEIKNIFIDTISLNIKNKIQDEVEQIENEFQLYINKNTSKEFNDDNNNNNTTLISQNNNSVNEDNKSEDLGEDDDENSESEPSIDNIDETEIKHLLPLGKKNKRYKRFPKGKRIKLYNKNMESLSNKNRNPQEQQPTSTRQHFNKTLFSLPQLKTQQTPSNTNKPPTLALNTISTPSKSSSITFQPKTPKQPQTQMNINSNTNNNENNLQETNKSNLKKPTNNNTLIPIVPKKETVVVNSRVIVRIDNHTQTEEIFFKMHWSFFVGTFPIISVKHEGYGKIKKTRINNINYIQVKNEQPNNLHLAIHKRLMIQKNVFNNMVNYVTQNNRNNESGNLQSHINRVPNKNLKINLGLHSLASGTILINKVSSALKNNYSNNLSNDVNTNIHNNYNNGSNTKGMNSKRSFNILSSSGGNKNNN